MYPLDATNSSFIMGFIVFVLSRRDTASQYGKRHNISISRLRYSANHNALESWPIRARFASKNDEICKNWCVSQRRGIKEQQYIYIYAFSRHFYPKRLTVHSGYTVFVCVQ